jgi:hypothetical protein
MKTKTIATASNTMISTAMLESAREHTSDRPGKQRECKGHREHVEDEIYH